jgi:tRNA(adenine34) deaminase
MDLERNQQNHAQQLTDCVSVNAGLFNLPAEEIAQSLASPKGSPHGASSGLRLLTFYINYAGKRLSVSRRRNLEKAKKLLSGLVTRELIEREREQQHKAA